MISIFAHLSRSAADVQVGNHGDVDLFSARATGFTFCIFELRCRRIICWKCIAKLRIGEYFCQSMLLEILKKQ